MSLPNKLTLLGLLGLLLWLWGAFTEPVASMRAYYFAWLFWICLSLGALLVKLLATLIPSRWGAAVAQGTNAATLGLPLTALLILPVFFFMAEIFPWAQEGYFQNHHWPHKSNYLTVGTWILRTVVYLISYSALGLSLCSSRIQGRALPAIALPLYALSMLFAGTDWVMSLTPEWYSSMFPVIFMATQFLAGLAMVTLTSRNTHPDTLHDLGNLLLAFVVFWTYVSFSQYLIIWSGNLPREIGWYLERRSGHWPQWLAGFVLMQFALPFALLLSRTAKRHEHRLKTIAAIVLMATVLNVYWLVAPSFHRALPHWQEPLAFTALGALWAACFVRNLKKRAYG